MEASLLCCVCSCGLGCHVWWVRCWRWGVGLWASGGALCACLVCRRRWLCMGGLPAVGLAPALGVGCWASVGVCGACCGCPPPLWCAALLCSAALCAVLRCPCTRAPLVCIVLRYSSVRLRQLCVPRRCVILCCSGVCCAVLFRCVPLSVLTYHTVLCAALHQQRMAAMAPSATATLFHGGQVLATSEALGCHHTPIGGARSKHTGPANENCLYFSSHLISCVRLCQPYGPRRYAALCCCNVCCAALRYASERHFALRCSVLLHCVRAALCCVLCCFTVRRCRPRMCVCCGALCCSAPVRLLPCIALVRAARRGPTALSASHSLNASGRPL